MAGAEGYQVRLLLLLFLYHPRHFDMSGVDLKLEASSGLVVLEVPGLQEGRPSLLKGDKMYLREAASNKMVEYEAFVHQVG